MAGGLKHVRNRRDDTLSRVGWEQFEHLLGDYYGRQGYSVEHARSGGSRPGFDGGIDLKLRKDDEYIVVQCKRWNAYKVPHNEVHQLLGVMVNQGATGAILVTSGEFTRAAIEAATKQGHVQLIDGDDLRAMLGPLPEPGPQTESAVDRAVRLQASVRPSPGPRTLDDKSKVSLARPALAAFALLIFFWAVSRMFSAIQQIPVQQQTRIQAAATAQARQASLQAAAPRSTAIPAPDQSASSAYGRSDPDPCRELVDWQSGTYIDHCRKSAPHSPTAAEIRESQRKADEAMKVIEANTPDM